MRNLRIASGLVVGVLGFAPALSTPAQQAQQKPGSLMIAQEDTVKVSAREQYEGGRKQLAAWHATTPSSRRMRNRRVLVDRRSISAEGYDALVTVLL